MSKRDCLPYAIRKEYEDLLNRFKGPERLESFKSLVTYAEEKTDYLTAPASTKYHMSCEHGLLIHSLSVTSLMFDLRDTYKFNEITDDSIVLTGLFHDLGKVGDPDIRQPMYLECEATEKQKAAGYGPSQPYKYNEGCDSRAHLEHAHGSIFLITRMMQLSREEFQAILIHDGMILPANQAYSMKECKLQTILHQADVNSAKWLEVE